MQNKSRRFTPLRAYFNVEKNVAGVFSVATKLGHMKKRRKRRKKKMEEEKEEKTRRLQKK